jgi:hypothetical protein
VSNNKNVTQDNNDAVRRDEPDLHSLYGEIGIPAVAAALQFKCETKNRAYGPVFLPRRTRGPELNLQ